MSDRATSLRSAPALGLLAQAPPIEGSGAAVEVEIRPLSQRFMEDWHGGAILGGIAFAVVVAAIMSVLKRANAVSRLGEGLPREVRVQIKSQEDRGNPGAAADILFAHERFGEAAELYTQAQDWIRAGEAFDKSGNVAKAVQMYKRGNAPIMAGDAYLRRQQFASAGKEYEAANAIERAAEAFLKAKDYRKAADLYQKQDRLQESGDCYDRVGDKENAATMWIANFERQFDIARGDLTQIKGACDLANKACEYLIELGRAEEAAPLFQRAGFRRRAAEVFADVGKLDLAAQIYVEANKPLHAAKLYEAAGDEKKAKRFYGEAKLLDGDRAGAAEDLAAAGDLLRAAELFNESDNLIRAAEVYEQAGDVRMAADLFQAAGERVRAARAFEKSGDFGQAMQLYREAGDYKAELQAAKAGNNFYRVGEILLEHGRKEDALAAFQRMDPSEPFFEQANVIQGDILRDLGRLDVAFHKYKAAIGAGIPSKANVDILYKMAETAEAAKADHQALQLYESVIGVDYYFRDASDKAAKLRKSIAAAGGHMPSIGAFGTAFGTVAGAYPPQPTTAPSPARPVQTTADQPAPKAEKRYEVLGEIARGGMGVVFKARDTVLDRIVAYKVLAANLKTNKVAVKYFLREAQAAAKMTHPNIVTVFDAGEQDGEYYMAMEYVEGQTLKQLVTRQGSFPEKLVRYILVHACRGLAYSHERGLVHRDIKPGNMMLTKDRALKIMDFGLAKFVEEVQAQHTRSIGTPYYMSPEQIIGKELDGRSDLYSLGVSLFECATGQVPFSKGDLSYHHLHTAPPAVIDINPKISKELSDIIAKCMAKKPEDRYASALDLMNQVK